MGGEGEGEEGGEGGGECGGTKGKINRGNFAQSPNTLVFSPHPTPPPSRPFENEPLDDRDFSPAI